MTSNRPVSERMVERAADAFIEALRPAMRARFPDADEAEFQRTWADATKDEREVLLPGIRAVLAIAAIPSAGGVEEMRECELCNKPLLLGQFVNHYDDVGTVHMDCERPFVKPSEPCASPNDGENMQTFVLLGEPALLEELK